jgi:hypothetical protein
MGSRTVVTLTRGRRRESERNKRQEKTGKKRKEKKDIKG